MLIYLSLVWCLLMEKGAVAGDALHSGIRGSIPHAGGFAGTQSAEEGVTLWYPSSVSRIPLAGIHFFTRNSQCDTTAKIGFVSITKPTYHQRTYYGLLSMSAGIRWTNL